MNGATRQSDVAETRWRWDQSGQGLVLAAADKQRAPFIAGPLPLAWISQAAALGGKTLHVGLALWYLAGLTKSRVVRLTSKALTVFGVSRDAKYPALERLDKAGLVRVDQRPGCLPLVTILQAPSRGSD